jgi:hypothetical protein
LTVLGLSIVDLPFAPASAAGITVTISGTVLDDEGYGLPAADVMVIGAEAPSGSGATTSTDSTGHYSVAVTLADEPRAVATFSKGDDWSVQRRGSAVVDGSAVDGLDGQLRHFGSISGRITSDIASVKSVRVDLDSTFGGHNDMAQTEADGTFRFDGVPTGSYRLLIAGDGNSVISAGGGPASGSRVFEVHPDEDVTLAYEIVPVAAQPGQVAIDYSGPAIYRQSGPKAYPLGSPRSSQSSTVNPERQPTILGHLPPGRYKIALDEFTWYGGASRSSATVVTVKEGETTSITAWKDAAEAENSARDWAMGRFVTEDGAAALDLNIELLRRDAPNEVVAARMSSRGGFEFFDLPEADYLVRASDATGTYRSRTVSVPEEPSSSDTYVLTREVPLGPAFDGPATGSASMIGRNGPICLYPTNGRTAPGDLVCGEYDSATQRYQITGIKSGTYRIHLGHPGDDLGNPGDRFAPWVGGRSKASATVFSFTAGEYRELEAEPPRTTGELVGAAIDESGHPVDNLTFFAYAADNSDEVVATAEGGEIWRMYDLEVRPYKIKVVDGSGHYESTWIGGSDFASALPVTPPIAGTKELPSVVVNRRPNALAPPTLSGSARVGHVLTATTGVWRDEDLSFAYQWLRDGAPIPGATDPEYLVTSADVGRGIAARVITTDPSGDRADTTSGTVGSFDGPPTALPRPEARLIPTVQTTVKALGGRRVRVSVKVSAPGIVPIGRVSLRSGGKTVMSWRTLKNGRLSVTLKRQPRNRRVKYTVRYSGSVIAMPVTRQTTRVRVR